MSWWQNELLLLSALQYSDEDSYEVLKHYTAANGFTTEQLFHLTGKGHMAFYIEERDGAKLDDYLRASHRRGIREIIYTNVHCLPQDMRDRHPDWVQLDAHGQELRIYEDHYFLCIQSPAREAILHNLERLCHHAIDGVFLDGPVIAMEGCHCPACQSLFRERYGHGMEQAGDDEKAQFRIDSVTSLLRDIHRVVKAVNPEILLYCNNSALRSDRATGSSTRAIEPYVDLLGAEGGFVWVNRTTSLWPASPMAKLLESQARGKPTVIFIAGDYKPWSFCMHTASETTLYYAQSIANGANVWYGIHGPTEQMQTEGGRAAIQANQFIRDHHDLLRNTHSTAKVAVLWSQDTANWYQTSVSVADFAAAGVIGATDAAKGDHYRSLMGFEEILQRCHVQHDILDEVNILEGDLARYELLILPTTACMSDPVAERIRTFVQAGGHLIASFDSGFYDEKGRPAPMPKLADVQGIAALEGFVDYRQAGNGYMRVSRRDPYTAGVMWKRVPSPLLALHVRPIDDASVVAAYTVPMPSRYSALPSREFPAIIRHRCGKGTCLTFTGSVGEFYNAYTHPDYKTMVYNAVKRYADTVVESDAPGSVEIVLRRAGDRYVLHLINATGEMERPLTRIIPLQDVHIALTLGRAAHRALSVTGVQPADFHPTDTGCVFTLPVVGQYEVLSIE